jgi:Mg-chelatase subunit ChlI
MPNITAISTGSRRFHFGLLGNHRGIVVHETTLVNDKVGDNLTSLKVESLVVILMPLIVKVYL